MKHTPKYHMTWLMMLSLCFQSLAIAQQPQRDTGFKIEDVLGKWTMKIQGSDSQPIEEITIKLKDKQKNTLTLEGKHKDWEGTFTDGMVKFTREPSADEMDDAAPDWARKEVASTHTLKWHLELMPKKECGDELILEGNWYRGELGWTEERDSQTEQVIKQIEAKNTGAKGQPAIPVTFTRQQTATKATIRFVRQAQEVRAEDPTSVDRVEGIDLVFLPEKVMVEVQTAIPVTFNSIPILIRINNQTVSSSCSKAMAANRITSTVFRTQPVEVVPVNDPKATRPKGGVFLTAKEFDVLRADQASSGPLEVDPTTTRAVVSRTPARYGSLWKEALLRAAKLEGVEIPEKGFLSNQEATKISDVSLFNIYLKIDPFGKSKRWVLNKLGANLHDKDPIIYSTVIKVGDHAAMILLKNVFIEMMKDFSKGLDESRISKDDAEAMRFYKEIAPYVMAGNYPLSNVEVAAPSSSLLGRNKVPFEKAFDDKYLRYEFRSQFMGVPTVESMRKQDIWKLAATREAYGIMVRSTAYSISKAENTPDSNIEELIKLTGIGFDRAVERLTPRLVKLEDMGQPPRQYWVTDNQARFWVSNLKTTAQAVAAQKNESAIDSQVAILSACLVAPFLGVETLAGKLITASVDIANLNFALDQEREAAEKEERYQFALGGSNVVGTEILGEAEAQRTPRWAVLLNRVGILVSVVAVDQALTRLSKVEVAARGVELVPQIQKGGISAFRQLSSEDQAKFLVFARDAELTKVTRCEAALTDAQRDALKTMEQLSEEARLNPPKPVKVTASTKAAALARASELIPKFESGGLDALRRMTKPDRADLLTIMEAAEDAKASGNALTQEQKAALRAADRLKAEINDRLYETAIFEDPFCTDRLSEPGMPTPRSNKIPHEGMPPPNTMWKTPNGKLIRLGEVIGNGEYVTTYKLLDELGYETGEVIKIVRKPSFDESTLVEITQRMQRGYDLLESEGIPHLKSQFVFSDTKPYIIQSEVNAAKDTILVNPGDHLPPELQEAALRLYKQMAEKDLIWVDGHAGNVFFKKEGDKWIAGVLDPDMILKWGQAPNNQFLAERLALLESTPAARGIKSMAGVEIPKDLSFNWDPQSTVRVFPDADFFMEKMLEAKGWISFDENGHPVGRMLDPEIVSRPEFFPKLGREPNFVAPTKPGKGAQVRPLIFFFPSQIRESLQPRSLDCLAWAA